MGKRKILQLIPAPTELHSFYLRIENAEFSIETHPVLTLALVEEEGGRTYVVGMNALELETIDFCDSDADFLGYGHDSDATNWYEVGNQKIYAGRD